MAKETYCSTCHNELDKNLYCSRCGIKREKCLICGTPTRGIYLYRDEMDDYGIHIANICIECKRKINIRRK